jgi:hypothetical protein
LDWFGPTTLSRADGWVTRREGAPNFGGASVGKGPPDRRRLVRIPPSSSHLVLYRDFPELPSSRSPRCKAKVRTTALSAVDQLGTRGCRCVLPTNHPAAARFHCSRSHPALVLGNYWCTISLLKTVENITNSWGHGRVGGRSRVSVFRGRLIEGPGNKTLCG